MAAFAKMDLMELNTRAKKKGFGTAWCLSKLWRLIQANMFGQCVKNQKLMLVKQTPCSLGFLVYLSYIHIYIYIIIIIIIIIINNMYTKIYPQFWANNPQDRVFLSAESGPWALSCQLFPPVDQWHWHLNGHRPVVEERGKKKRWHRETPLIHSYWYIYWCLLILFPHTNMPIPSNSTKTCPDSAASMIFASRVGGAVRDPATRLDCKEAALLSHAEDKLQSAQSSKWWSRWSQGWQPRSYFPSRNEVHEHCDLYEVGLLRPNFTEQRMQVEIETSPSLRAGYWKGSGALEHRLMRLTNLKPIVKNVRRTDMTATFLFSIQKWSPWALRSVWSWSIATKFHRAANAGWNWNLTHFCFPLLQKAFWLKPLFKFVGSNLCFKFSIRQSYHLAKLVRVRFRNVCHPLSWSSLSTKVDMW